MLLLISPQMCVDSTDTFLHALGYQPWCMLDAWTAHHSSTYQDAWEGVGTLQA